MFVDNNRNQRLRREAKAIERKASRNGTKLSGRDRARLTKVNGQIVKYNTAEDTDTDGYDREYD